MIDIEKIRNKSVEWDELKRLREYVITEVNIAADNGQWTTTILIKDGAIVVWTERAIQMVINDLNKDGFKALKEEKFNQEWLYIDWIEEYADTDSVKLPESCPEVAPESRRVCQNCKWFLQGAKECQLKDAIICSDPSHTCCHLYESED